MYETIWNDSMMISCIKAILELMSSPSKPWKFSKTHWSCLRASPCERHTKNISKTPPFTKKIQNKPSSMYTSFSASSRSVPNWSTRPWHTSYSFICSKQRDKTQQDTKWMTSKGCLSTSLRFTGAGLKQTIEAKPKKCCWSCSKCSYRWGSKKWLIKLWRNLPLWFPFSNAITHIGCRQRRVDCRAACKDRMII